FDRIIIGFTNNCAIGTLYHSHGHTVFCIPIITLCWGKFDNGNAGVVLAFGKPGLHERIPQFGDFLSVGCNLRPSVKHQKIAMCRTLKQQLNRWVKCYISVFMAIGCTEKPEASMLIDVFCRHGPSPERLAGLDARAEKARTRFLCQLCYFIECFLPY